MKIGLYRRESLESGNVDLVGRAASDQFQRTHGAINAWQEVEHDDDGHHTDITAGSIAVSGDVVVGGDISVGGEITGEGGNVGVGDLPIESVPGQPPQSPGVGIKIGPWRIISDAQNSPGTPTYPSLAFQFLNEAFGTYLFRFKRLAAYDWALTPFSGVVLRLGAGAPGERLMSVDTNVLAAGSAAVTGAVTADSIHTTNNIVADKNMSCVDLYCSGAVRAAPTYHPMGHWQDVPFAAGNFYAPAGGTWTVGAGSIQTNRYTVIGKTLHWTLYLNATSIAGAPLQLNITIPSGYTSATGRGAGATGQLYDGAYNRGLIFVSSASSISIQKDPAAAFTANTGATYIIANITMEIN